MSVTKEIKEKVKKNKNKVVSTGSTLLDLAISGTTYEEGGIPPGILVEVSGVPGCGKTVLLCEIAGYIQRAGGKVLFNDAEYRLNQQFAQIFNFSIDQELYKTPDTVKEMFAFAKEWKVDHSKINCVMADSIAVLSSELEMSDKGDKMGQRRAKDLHSELRTFCRDIPKKNMIVVFSNHIMEVTGSTGYVSYKSKGGNAIPYLASLRLRGFSPQKKTREVKVGNKKVERTFGVLTKFRVIKSSIDKGFREADVFIDFDYGIDDVRMNLQFIKDYTTNEGKAHGTYVLPNMDKLSQSIEESIRMVEKDNLEEQLKKGVIKLWQEIEGKFETNRKTKERK